ncbi:hypothetical protein DFH09DRAFT_1143723 [Mycena vulgaris]|nr:hypothetical protein DFH09DRAFT_1143723 [Mycena vulgaris]
MEAEYEALHSTQKHLIAGAYQHNCSGASGVPGRQLQSPRHRLDWLGHSIMFGGIRENDSLVKDVRGDIQPCTLELVCITSDRAEEEIADQEGLDGLRNEIETARHSFKAPYEAEGVDFDDGKLEEIEGVGEEREGSRLEATEEGLRDDGNGEEDEEFEYILEEWECDLPTATLTTRVALTTI